MQQPTTFRIFGTPRGRFVRLSKPTASSVNTFRPTGGFTLIELLVVISIIAILAALVLSAAGFVQKKGARDRASAEIAALGAALESFKADNGDYPSNSAPGSSAALVTNLMPSSGKVYFEFKSKSTNASGYNDPFGYPYNYIYTNGSPNNGSNNYDLWSTAGGSSSSNTWIKNW
ncbi:MAG: prepilin-type N-terminal cleavage/methylation domain-containing protein [bacterium]